MELTSSRYSARFDEKCWYTSGFVTPAASAMSSIVVARYPRCGEQLEGDGNELPPSLPCGEAPRRYLEICSHFASGYQ